MHKLLNSRQRFLASEAAMHLIAGESVSDVRAKIQSESLKLGLSLTETEASTDRLMQAAFTKQADFQAHVRGFWADLFGNDSEEEDGR
jgi:hypothetical protein